MARPSIERRCKRCGKSHAFVPSKTLCSKCEQKWIVINDPNDVRRGQVILK